MSVSELLGKYTQTRFGMTDKNNGHTLPYCTQTNRKSEPHRCKFDRKNVSD